MPKTTTNGTTNGTNGNGHQVTATKTPLESAFEQIETIKGSYREALRGLNTLTDTLRQIQRDQKSNEREVQNVRTTLEKLQQVRI